MRVCHACVLLWSAQVQCCWTYPGQGTLRITGNMSDATKVPPCIHRHPASFSAAYSSTQGSWFIRRVTGGGASSRRPRREEHRCHSTAAGHASGRQGRALPEEVRPRWALSAALARVMTAVLTKSYIGLAACRQHADLHVHMEHGWAPVTRSYQCAAIYVAMVSLLIGRRPRGRQAKDLLLVAVIILAVEWWSLMLVWMMVLGSRVLVFSEINSDGEMTGTTGRKKWQVNKVREPRQSFLSVICLRL